MASMNDAIRAATGGATPPSAELQSSSSTGNRVPANSVAIKNIATNGALLNQGMGRLIKAIDELKATWGA